jgi:hypothetical protein
MDNIYCPNCGKTGENIIERIGGVEDELAIDGVFETAVRHCRCKSCNIDFWIAYGK